MGGSSTADRREVVLVMARTGGDVKEAAKVMGRGEQFIAKWYKAAVQGTGFHKKRGQGRKKLIGRRAAGAAKQLAMGRKKVCAKEVAVKLARKGLVEKQVSKWTVARRLASGRARALRYKTQKRAQRLTRANMEARLQWAVAMKDKPMRYWRGLMFTDSHMFLMQRAPGGRKRWCVPGKEVVVQVCKHPSVVHAYAGVSWYGKTSLHFVTGTTGLKSETKGVAAQEYQRVISKTFVPEGMRLFDGTPFTVWEDGAPAHTAKSTRKYWDTLPTVQHSISPPASPDLNVIETCWSLVDDMLMGRNFTSFNAFKGAVRNAWDNLPLDSIQKLINSMPSRVHKVIKQGGGHIERNVYS